MEEYFVDYKLYKDRLKTFIAHWHQDFIAPERLARAGFYYKGPYDRVQCAFCESLFQGWDEHCADPTKKHKELRPNCEYFTKHDGKYVQI